MKLLRQVTGGYSNASRSIVRRSDGRTAFLKAAVDDQTAADVSHQALAPARLTASGHAYGRSAGMSVPKR